MLKINFYRNSFVDLTISSKQAPHKWRKRKESSLKIQTINND